MLFEAYVHSGKSSFLVNCPMKTRHRQLGRESETHPDTWYAIPHHKADATTYI